MNVQGLFLTRSPNDQCLYPLEFKRTLKHNQVLSSHPIFHDKRRQEFVFSMQY